MQPVHHNLPTRADLAALLRLAAPLVLIQVGTMLMGVVDTIMVGQVSPVALAAAALGNVVYFSIVIFGMGVLFALDPIVAQALGAGDELAVSRGLQRGLLLSAVLALPIVLVLLAARPLLEWVGQPIEVVPAAAGYVHRTALSVWPFFVFVVLRQTLQAHRRVAPILVTILAANGLNALLNFLWIFGNAGFPALGVLGAAWATVASRSFMAVALLVLGWSDLKPYLQHLAPRVFEMRPILRMLKLGAPIGGQMMLEGGAFGGVALLMGWLGVVQVAAHQVAINFASLTFMVPLGVSSAAAVIVGHAVGRGDAQAVHRATFAALAVGAGFMLATAALLIGAPRAVARLYSPDAEVLALAAALLPIAGVFQVFDGLQVVAIGLLRGLGDTRVPMIANVLGFWLIGIPVSLYMGFSLGLGAVGLWWGLVLGLVIVAVFLVARVRERERHELSRVLIDDHAPPVERSLEDQPGR